MTQGGIGGLLALDLSSRTGWTYGPPGARKAGGVWQLPPASNRGRQFNTLSEHLCDALDLFRPDAVLMEAALSVFAQTREDTARQQFGLAAMVELICDRYDMEPFEANSATVRKAVTGAARAPGKNEREKKQHWVRWCQANGYPDVLDDNEADSLILWRYGTAVFQRAGKWAALRAKGK